MPNRDEDEIEMPGTMTTFRLAVLNVSESGSLKTDFFKNLRQ